MKKILLPALAALTIVAAPAAFARTAGGWYVLTNSNTHACYAADRSATPGEEALGGPYITQAKAQSVMGSLVACGGQWEP